MNGRCGWCYADEEDVRMVQLTHSTRSGIWQEHKPVGKDCRVHLRGFFRYVRKVKVTK